jgi:hypothetical protein
MTSTPFSIVTHKSTYWPSFGLELNHEVRTLQARIQQSARNHTIQESGEGPVQAILEMDFGTTNVEPDRISILLWHDTPHAAWTWLEQIGRQVWDGAEFK